VVVQKEYLGYADFETLEPYEENSIFRIYSMTKPITTVALMTLYDEGKFELDDPVSEYIPGIAGTMVWDNTGSSLKPQAQPMTIRHLLTHSAGYTYGWNPDEYVDSLVIAAGSARRNGSLADMIQLLTGLPLKFQPGTDYEYGLSIDVAGYLIEVLSGMPLDEFFRERIFKPLKMEDSGFYVPEEKHDRLVPLYNINKDGRLVKVGNGRPDAFKSKPELFSGGGGMVSTVPDYTRFCRMLMNKGILEGERILEESTVELIMTDQLPPGVDYRKGYGYGLGGSVKYSSGEYCWLGAATTNFWIDPTNNLIVMVFIQLMPSNHSYADRYKAMVDRAVLND
jgi:CubicO group peptidase (beta-lactamase class C family)